jgi:hypothetical protein
MRFGRLLRIALRALALVVLLAVGEVLFFTLCALTLPPPAPLPPKPTQLRGVYHVHSQLSDGKGSIEDIASAATRAGLQFVILTDHNLVELPPPRFVAGVLIISATELSTPYGHVVALDLARGPTEAERQADNLFERIHQQGGAAFLAHPIQRRNPWRDPVGAKQADGMELYSGDSLFREALRRPFTVLLPALGTYVVRPAWGLWMLVRESGPTEELLLNLSRERRISGLCSPDAHGWPSYDAAFRALSLYLEVSEPLPADPIEAARRVTGALRAGAFHCGLGDWASADGFHFQGELDEKREARVGTTLQLQLPPSPPGRVKVRVFGGGRLLEDGAPRLLLERPGPLWVEVWVEPEGGAPAQGWRPWIVTSPLSVVPSGS